MKLQAPYILFALGYLSTAALQGTTPTLIWSDEFEVDGLPDSSKWVYDVGGNGWGNQEAQYYTDGRSENARVENGSLIIEARQEAWPSARSQTHEYTSARLLSKGSGDWTYGRIEVRAKLPSGVGTWPAIWMLSTGNEYGGWPGSGEIDIMEHVGFEQDTVHGSLHSLANNFLTGTHPTASIEIDGASEAFHTYAMEWTSQSITYFVDDVAYMTATNDETGWETWPFDQPFHLILNIAVGGTWGGQQGIDANAWPARMEIDFVRVYDLGETPVLDTDNDGTPNASDDDDDDDGLSDREEHAIGTSILKVDTDGDGYSDFDEIEAGTYPLLVGSFPGSDASILMINNDFSFGESPWLVHTNFLDEGGEWLGQIGSWGGVYRVFNFVAPTLSGEATFYNYDFENTARSEHLLYQEWSVGAIDLLPGDVIRFRGEASASLPDEFLSAQAYIRVMDRDYNIIDATVVVELEGEMGAFEIETVLPDESYNYLQVGFLLTGPQASTGSITFQGIEATINEELDVTWASYPVEDDWADTGDWLGYLYIGAGPWVWSHTMQSWIYLPESSVKENGTWIYVVRGG